MAREVAPSLWASLSQRLRAARLELGDALAALQREREQTLRDEHRFAQQEELRESVRRAGWCLGVLGAAQGVDLMRARRERDGLRWLVDAVAEARGLALTPNTEQLPQLRGRVGSAFELPLLAAWCVLRAGAGGARVRWRAECAGPGERLVFELGPAAESAELATCCARLSSAHPDLPRVNMGPARLELAWL